MTEFCSICKHVQLVYESEYDCGICYECQDRAIAKYERCRDWAAAHGGEWHDEQAEDAA